MASETILKTVTDFIANYPPFDQLPQPVLEGLAEGARVRYCEEGDVIFREAAPPHHEIFMVRKGGIKLTQNRTGEEVLVDQCDEGDLFGVRAILAHDAYLSTAVCMEETLLYSFPVASFKQLMESQPNVSLFFASDFAAGLSNAIPGREAGNSRKFLIKNDDHSSLAFKPAENLSVKGSDNIVSCSPEHNVRDAALLMTNFGVGSVLVTNKHGFPLGIITDADMRKKVITAADDIRDRPVTEIMSSPVHTIQKNRPLTEVTLKMMNQRFKHLCVTEDGTNQSPATGMISQRDVMVAQGSNPVVLAKQLLNSKSVAQIAAIRDKAEELVDRYLQADISVAYTASFITEINDVLILKAIRMAENRLAEEGYEKPALKYCWLSLGSEGRKEQLLRTDQDNALVFEDAMNDEEEREAYTYYRQFANYVNGLLMESGFEKCPADMMAMNPEWCQPLAVWKQYFTQWINAPDPQAVMKTTIFFDFRPVAGDSRQADFLRESIFHEISHNEVFIHFLAKNALQNPPPLSFFRNFIVEKSGDHKDAFDIKARAMMPLADAARCLAYDLRLPLYGSTHERFEALAQQDQKIRKIALEAADGYKLLMRFRAVNGLMNKDSGRFINPDLLSKGQKRDLRDVFKTIRELQEIMEVRFQLAFLKS